ncbi:hypothetical protein G6L09_11580 [Agrobacterium rhizogenes]|nr:hypothetical protein [Rhizobium rhizogenes]NTH71195.1 hypothetical protein [Rhizobium rhizogenes]
MTVSEPKLPNYGSLDDWPAILAVIETNPPPAIWNEIYDACLGARLQSRYFGPIKTITDKGERRGEGFAIMTIQCAVIEFLAALRVGWRFDHGNFRHGEGFRYWDSKRLYTDFLRRTDPFKAHFNKPQAKQFYVDIRCALVHEAQLRGRWALKAKSGTAKIIDFDNFHINRDRFGSTIVEYLYSYRSELAVSADLQLAFVRKFNDLFENRPVDTASV